MTDLVGWEYRPVPGDMQVVEARAPFERFYRHEYRPVLALAYVLSGSASLAEEVTQEAFMAPTRRLDA